jgi:hypothetical protein
LTCLSARSQRAADNLFADQADYAAKENRSRPHHGRYADDASLGFVVRAELDWVLIAQVLALL